LAEFSESLLSWIKGAAVAVVLCVMPALGQDAVSSTPPRSQSYGILINNSGALRMSLDRIIRISERIIAGNTANDETFLVTFVDAGKVTLQQELTADREDLIDAVHNVYVEGGQTAIADAVQFAAAYLVENGRASGRDTFLIVFTNGDDRGSTIAVDNVIRYLKEHSIHLYAIGIADENVQTKVTERLARGSGGRQLITAPRDDLSSSVLKLMEEIRATR